MAKEITKLLKLRNVKSPSRGYPTDAGIDFYIPKFDGKFISDFKSKNKNINIYYRGESYLELKPHERALIPSGIYLRMSEPGRALIAANKSGVASKNGLIFGAQVIDYTYQGEIHINIINTSDKIVKIYEDQKIIQFLEIPVITNELEIIEGQGLEGDKDHTDFYKGMTKDRLTGGFGSTDKK